ncbi:AbrB family transcriptional regulator [Neotabrizicola sp. sgz301269]|uniref:AbrB family transcriptional regulator n=1 Tax=Neotabrizicola sp. sgz301269 TaxID=3276282 RepID=UPI00376F75E1
MPARPPILDLLSWNILFTLIIAVVGGWAFHRLGLPLPWMMGAMALTMLAAMLGMPLRRTRPLRPPFAAVIGVTLGSAFQPAVLGQGAAWVVVMAATALVTMLCGGLGYLYLRRVAGFDPVTAYFAGMPSGIQEMTLQGGLAGGDERQIALVHSTRIFLLVMVVPLLYAATYGVRSTGSPLLSHSISELGAIDWSWLILAGAIGWPLGKRIGLPNPAMIGPLIISAILHLTGIAKAAPPSVLILISQVVLGSALGSGFLGTKWGLVRHAFLHGLVLVPILCAICVTVAIVAAPLAGLPWSVVFLPMAPGGAAEMSLIALALHAEVALVTSSQLVRILMINLGATAVFRLLRLTKT